MDAFDEVLSNINGRSKHIPRLEMVGVIEKGVLYSYYSYNEIDLKHLVDIWLWGSAGIRERERPLESTATSDSHHFNSEQWSFSHGTSFALENRVIYSLDEQPTLIPNFRGVPTGLALSVGLGMVRALATLHRCGFILRYVTPFSFLLKTPFSIKSLEKNVVILDLGMTQVWPEP